MKTFPFLLALAFLFLLGCESKQKQMQLPFEVYCEMVANDAKPVALSQPMDRKIVDEHWDLFQSIAADYDVELFREKDFPTTLLFPDIGDQEVILIYRGARLSQYRIWKNDLSTIPPLEAARRFGRLLGYSPQGINELLMKNSDFRTLESFGVDQQITHLYYEDVDAAKLFYEETLGLPAVGENAYSIGSDAWIALHAHNEDHPIGQAKSTAIALLTDELPEWYAYVQAQGIEIKYTYKPRNGGPHDGFVAIDPGGYLLEFEEFKQHPENELFLAVLEYSPRVFTKVDSLSFFGSITWTYHNDLLKMQNYYEQELGFRMVADQGWTKIFQTSPTGFIGLVDERRGMMDYADEKAVEIEWRLDDLDAALAYFSNGGRWMADGAYLVGSEKYRYQIR